MSGGNLTTWGAQSKALQKNYVVPDTNDPKLWKQNYAMLQPTDNCEDHIPSYGSVDMRMGYDGVYRKINKRLPTTDTGNYHRTPLATAGIKPEEYGDVMTDYDITSMRDSRESSVVEFVNSEISIAKKNGKQVYGLDKNYPIKDPHPLYMTSRANLDYAAGKVYDFNSHSWTTRDIPNYGRYPESLENIDFSQRLELRDPVFVKATSGSDACDLEGVRDHYDPRPDPTIYTNSNRNLQDTHNYERKYKNMQETTAIRHENFTNKRNKQPRETFAQSLSNTETSDIGYVPIRNRQSNKTYSRLYSNSRNDSRDNGTEEWEARMDRQLDVRGSGGLSDLELQSRGFGLGCGLSYQEMEERVPGSSAENYSWAKNKKDFPVSATTAQIGIVRMPKQMEFDSPFDARWYSPGTEIRELSNPNSVYAPYHIEYSNIYDYRESEPEKNKKGNLQKFSSLQNKIKSLFG